MSGSEYVSDGTPSLPINVNHSTDVYFNGLGFNVDEGLFIPAMATYEEELQPPATSPLGIQEF